VHADYGGRIGLDRCILGSVMSDGGEEGVLGFRLEGWRRGCFQKLRGPYVALCYGRDRDVKEVCKHVLPQM
jgi:hypothetical protein